MAIPPVVRQMLVCDGVQSDPAKPKSLNILGYVHTIRAKPPRAFPVAHPELCVFLALAGGVGTGTCRVAISDADSSAVIHSSPDQQISYPSNRLHVGGAVFRFRPCIFPRAGLYWVEFYHDGMMLRSEPLVVR